MPESHAPSSYLKRPFRIAHLVWAGIAVGLTALLVFFGGEGHPPGIILLPVVWGVWLLGHGALWASRRLALEGRSRTRSSMDGGLKWPPGLFLFTIGTGFATAVGLLPLVMTVAGTGGDRFRDPLWAIMAAIWLVHGVCFVGLLLRRGWSRLLAALLCFGWAALLIAQFVDHVLRDLPIHTGELAIAIVLIGIGIFYGWHLLASPRIRGFLAAPDSGRVVPK